MLEVSGSNLGDGLPKLKTEEFLGQYQRQSISKIFSNKRGAQLGSMSDHS
jgi:hypothetical protein